MVTIRRFAALAGAVSALLASPALGQDQTVALQRVDPEANLVEELVVNARLPGPAWWKVTDADTTVYVLGVPAMTPTKLEVDSSVLKRRLDGADRLIMGQEADVSVVRL